MEKTDKTKDEGVDSGGVKIQTECGCCSDGTCELNPNSAPSEEETEG